jgi:hypothetical protein
MYGMGRLDRRGCFEVAAAIEMRGKGLTQRVVGFAWRRANERCFSIP